MVKYKYDVDTMIEKIREKWSPEDFLQATKNLMYAGYINYEQSSRVNFIQNKNTVANDNNSRSFNYLASIDDFSTEKDFVLAAQGFKMSDATNPVIQIKAYRITNINYHQYDTKTEIDALKNDKTEEQKNDLKMKYSISKNGDTGIIEMTANLLLEEQKKMINITVNGLFKYREDIKDNEEKKKFLMINGAAMIYPYLRSTVSMVVSMDNPLTTVLPSLNFVEQFKNFNEKEQDEQK